MIKAWMRELKIILTSTSLRKRVTFGTDYEKEGDSLNITVDGYKYLSSLKDNVSVKIDNLTYKEVVELISGQFYDIEIKAGYRDSGAHTIFKGSVLYISNLLGDRKTNTVVILCASRLVAAYGQSRMNLGLQSGINMYAALNFLCKRAGVRNSNVSEEFKNKIIREASEVNTTLGSFLDTFVNSNNFIINSDATGNADVSVWDPYRKDNRVIKLEASTIILTSGYPTLSSDGLKISLMLTFNFMPGDTIQVDNSIIDIGVESKDQVNENRGFFLDESGKYMIYEIEYHLTNRGSAFSLNMLCKARNLVSKISGVEGYK